MSPLARSFRDPLCSFPRVSGDEPDGREVGARVVRFSPRERG